MRPESDDPGRSFRHFKGGSRVWETCLLGKALVTSLDKGKELLNLATARQLLIGNAPDTFLGGRWQTVRNLIDTGVIGEPSGFTAHVGTHGVEASSKSDFYYKEGGGPLFDLGPYTWTVLVFLFGPMTKVCGMGNHAARRPG